MGKPSTTVGYRYYLGVEAGMCLGPIDEITILEVGDRVAWRGSQTVSGPVDINNPNLFGGDKQEGGVSGIMEVRMGEGTQQPDPYMQGVIGTPIPANRGLFSLIFRGRTYSEIVAAALNVAVSTTFGRAAAAYVGKSGFYWASLNPYIKTITPTIRRILQGWTTPVWYPEKAEVTQSIDYSTPPSTTPDYTTYLRGATDASQTRLSYPVNFTDLTSAFVGYVLINNEWMKVTSVNDGLGGGNTGDYMTFAVVRAQFGTTAVAHILGSVAYFFAASVVPIRAMNPAHILYQCLTDTVWGVGKSTALIDQTTWMAAADALYDENFGLCMVWSAQSTMEDFCSEILKHIDGILDLNIRTGLYELRLIRNDYDVTTLPVFDVTNIVSFDNFARSGWGETTNEIIVKFTDQVTGNAASVSVQDLANIYIQRANVSQTHEYPGVQLPSLAYRLAERDLRALSTPLAIISIKVNRTGWSVKKGDPFVINWAPLNIAGLVCRVIDISLGTLDEGTITINALEDVFALPVTSYGQAQPPLWANPAGTPHAVANARVLEVPYFVLNSLVDVSKLIAPNSFPLVMAQKPAVQNNAMTVYSAVDEAFTYPVNIGQSDYNTTLALLADVPWDATLFTYGQVVGDSPDMYQSGGLALIDDEWIGITGVDTTAKTITVLRGVLDSYPEPHTAGTLIWLYATAAETYGFSGVEGNAVAVLGVTEYYKETGRSTSGESPLLSAPEQTYTHQSTWYDPYPPADVKISGILLPTVPVGGNVTITWNGRNRLQQIVGLTSWFDAQITPELGSTYTIKIRRKDTGDVVFSQSNLKADQAAGTYQIFNYAVKTTSHYTLEIYTVRNGYESQHYFRDYDIYGYNYEYGYQYGGSQLGVIVPRGAPPHVIPPIPGQLKQVTTFTFSGVFSTLDDFNVQFLYGDVINGTQQANFNHTVDCSTKTSLRDCAVDLYNALAFVFDGNISNTVVVLDGLTISFISYGLAIYPSIMTNITANFTFNTVQDPKPVLTGSPQLLYLDLWVPDTFSAYRLAPQSDISYSAPVDLTQILRFGSPKYSVQKAQPNLQNTNRTINWEVVAPNTTNLTYNLWQRFTPNADPTHVNVPDAISVSLMNDYNMTVYEGEYTGAQYAGGGMQRIGTVFSMNGDYRMAQYIVGDGAHYGIGQTIIFELQAGSVPYPNGAKQLTTTSISYYTNPAPIAAGQVATLNLDNTTVAYTITAADAATGNFVSTLNALAALVNPVGTYTMNVIDQYGTTEIERTVIDTPFTYSGFLSYGGVLTSVNTTEA